MKLFWRKWIFCKKSNFWTPTLTHTPHTYPNTLATKQRTFPLSGTEKRFRASGIIAIDSRIKLSLEESFSEKIRVPIHVKNHKKCTFLYQPLEKLKAGYFFKSFQNRKKILFIKGKNINFFRGME
jgi:hypothetical protein